MMSINVQHRLPPISNKSCIFLPTILISKVNEHSRNYCTENHRKNVAKEPENTFGDNRL